MWFVQLFDIIFSVLNMPRGRGVFEGSWLSLVAPRFSSMIEARQREDETECDMGVNGAFRCHFDDLMYYSVTLNAHRSVQTHTSTQVVHACVCTDWFLGLGLLDERTNIKEATGKNVAERVKKTNKTLTCNKQQQKRSLCQYPASISLNLRIICIKWWLCCCFIV